MFHPDNKERIAEVADARKRVAAFLYLANSIGWVPLEYTPTEELVKICRGVKKKTVPKPITDEIKVMFDNLSKLAPNVRFEVWDKSRVFSTSVSGNLNQRFIRIALMHSSEVIEVNCLMDECLQGIRQILIREEILPRDSIYKELKAAEDYLKHTV
jgi:hypothetical protein